jgi:hypothetical protein
MIYTVLQNGLLRFDRDGYGTALFAGNEPLYKIGYECGTCGDMFSLLDFDNPKLMADSIDSTLREAIYEVDEDLLARISPLLPKGVYRVGLLQLMPTQEVIEQGEDTSYKFSGRKLTIETSYTEEYEEHTSTFESEDREAKLKKRQRTYKLSESEVILPHQSLNSINWQTVSEYRHLLRSRNVPPTALALSIGEWRTPRGGTHTYQRLTHFLIDGHHKMLAASEEGLSIQLLSLFHKGESRLSLNQLNVRHPGEYCGKRLEPDESLKLWLARQRDRVMKKS